MIIDKPAYNWTEFDKIGILYEFWQQSPNRNLPIVGDYIENRMLELMQLGLFERYKERRRR